MTRVSMAQVRRTYKARDSWWTVLLVDPVAGRLVRAISGVAWLTPTRLTVTAFGIGMAGAFAFWQASPGWLIVGAVLYHVSFTVDCVDGKIARLRQQSSMVGQWLDFLLDRIRVFVCAMALFSGLHRLTGDDRFLLAAAGVVFLSLIGYLNGAETDRLGARMRERTTSAAHVAAPAEEPGLPSVVQEARTLLHRRRIRANLVSAIEFEMGLFIVAPLVAAATEPVAVLWVTVVAATLLVAFELALAARFWWRARAYDRSAAGDLPTPRRGDVAVDHGPANIT